MNETEDILKIKVVNQLTGEITEVEVTSAEQAKNLYIELVASMKAMDNAKKQLLGFLDTFLGNDDNYLFADGKKLSRKQRKMVKWTLEGLHHVGIDEDAIAVISNINMTAAKELVKELMERGDIKPDSYKYLDENAEVSYSAPYVEVR